MAKADSSTHSSFPSRLESTTTPPTPCFFYLSDPRESKLWSHSHGLPAHSRACSDFLKRKIHQWYQKHFLAIAVLAEGETSQRRCFLTNFWQGSAARPDAMDQEMVTAYNSLSDQCTASKYTWEGTLLRTMSSNSGVQLVAHRRKDQQTSWNAALPQGSAHSTNSHMCPTTRMIQWQSSFLRSDKATLLGLMWLQHHVACHCCELPGTKNKGFPPVGWVDSTLN